MTSGSKQDAIQVRTERMATGGEAVARLPDGRVVFVRGALVGEQVQITLIEQKKRFARGVVDKVIDPAPARIEPACLHAVSDCGGCDWMHIHQETQRTYKMGIVIEQLQRLGGIDSPNVTMPDMERGRRTTVRCTVTNGRAGYRKRRSDAGFVASECDAAHPLLQELIVDGRFGNATEVTLRAGAVTGERLVLTDGHVRSVVVPDGVLVASSHDPGTAAIHEEVAGQMWRISAKSFFQTSHQGAETLVAAVARGLQGSAGPVVDLYGGVGLLGGGAAGNRLTCAVESNPSSTADARVNLGPNVQVHTVRVERWKPQEFATVIADPARRGLGKEGAAVIDQTAASRLVLVSCDPASLGRDTALLKEQGWLHDRGEVIDLFPDTSRIEVVSTFRR